MDTQPPVGGVQALRQAVPEERGGTMALKIGAPDPNAAREASAKEQRRLQQGTPPTQLEPGESVLVPHWEVTRTYLELCHGCIHACRNIWAWAIYLWRDYRLGHCRSNPKGSPWEIDP